MIAPHSWVGQQLAALLDERIQREVDAQLTEQQLAAARSRDARADEQARRRAFTADVLLGAGSRFDRTLSARPLAQLAAQIRALSGEANVDYPILRAYRALLEHEGRGLGRIAGSTYNILGKLVLPPLLRPPAGPILEIGTLFGLFAPALVHQFRNVGDFRCLTVIDPLAGTQIQPGHPGVADPTGTPVTLEVATRNFAAFGLRPEEVRIVRGYSTDADVRDQAGDRDYAVIIIDGDHSEAGVYSDLWWVQDVLTPGGLVVMDDWGDGHWPGVEAAGRRYLADGGRLQLVGQASTSAYLRAP